MLIQEGGASFVCGEGWKVSLPRKILPEVFDREVALRTAELGDSYDKTRAFVMTYAAQERIHSNTDMDTSELSWGNDREEDIIVVLKSLIIRKLITTYRIHGTIQRWDTTVLRLIL